MRYPPQPKFVTFNETRSRFERTELARIDFDDPKIPEDRCKVYSTVDRRGDFEFRHWGISKAECWDACMAALDRDLKALLKEARRRQHIGIEYLSMIDKIRKIREFAKNKYGERPE